MTPAIRNHYIPQFYQRGFIADGSGLIWVYEKGRQPRQKSVRKTGMELNLYAFVNQKKELDTQTVENELAKLDSNGAGVIHKLEKGLLLSEEERWTLCRFVSVMWRRTVKHKNHAEQTATGMIKKFFEDHDDKWLYDRLRERLRSETEAKALFDKQKAELEEIREEYARQVPVSCFRVTHYVNLCSRKYCSLWIGRTFGLHRTQNLSLAMTPSFSTKAQVLRTNKR
jgi:Protein of unknown function (DUF4238)